MGKSIPSSFQLLTRLFTSNRINKIKPFSSHKPAANKTGLHKSESIQPNRVELRKNMDMGNSSSSSSVQQRSLPLSEVVADCVKRWFEDTLKEAQAGESSMQVLVGQMYNSGYGVPKNAQKGKAWIERASKSRSSALRVGDKRPGYNVSDSDSDSDDENVKGK